MSTGTAGTAGAGGAGRDGRGRFLTGARVHVPGVDLVADSRLSLADDPYLADYRVDGRATLPAVVALEAMAQAACALAGRPLDEITRMAFDRPVAVPDDGGAVIRVRALRCGPLIETVLRCEETDFHVDHFRAAFPLEPTDGTLEVPRLGPDGPPLSAADLYGAAGLPGGPACFPTGRFRRVIRLTLAGPRGCRGELRGDDALGWFGAGYGRPVLGSPGLNDAVIHALQACVPRHRLLPSGGERLLVRPSQGDVRLHAVGRGRRGDEHVWDVTATDVRGRLVVAWTGLRLREADPAGWEPPPEAAGEPAGGPAEPQEPESEEETEEAKGQPAPGATLSSTRSEPVCLTSLNSPEARTRW
ncbi:polyketide synthase dehydratase domain-containing protein [Streptosporangium sp. NPDC048047]|uniref:polyketide synthase dehydratase domain-containing protein n=1 Tax=Streptosporangium sp. NPDC048047 TaxID=3155748 RepID=UPI00342BF11D